MKGGRRKEGIPARGPAAWFLTFGLFFAISGMAGFYPQA